jgi:hypothetical protein
MGANDGSIIATIITTHMPTNDTAATGHLCPGMRIQTIDIVQPPGIGIPRIDMGPHQIIVSAVLVAKSNAMTPTKVRWEVWQIQDSEFLAREVMWAMMLVSVFPIARVQGLSIDSVGARDRESRIRPHRCL